MNHKTIPLYVMILFFSCILAYSLYQCFQSPEQEPVAEEELFVEPPVVEEVKEAVQTEEQIPDLDALCEANPDCQGWFTIPDTDISLPVVMGQDNSYYLKHSFTGEYSNFGCPFINVNTPLTNDSVVIHGHNMGNNRTEMFSPLMRFQDQEYAAAHDSFLLWTKSSQNRGEVEKREYTLYAIINYKTGTETYPYIQSNFESEEKRSEYLTYFRDRSIYSPQELAASGQLLILSTCNTYYGTDNRFLLLAVSKDSYRKETGYAQG